MSSSMKRMKTESSPTSEPSGTVQLYKLLRAERPTFDDSRRIYPILPFIGWSYLKELIQVDRSKETCHIFELSELNPDVGAFGETSRASNLLATGESRCVLPTKISEIQVFAPDSKNPTEWLRFAFIFPFSLSDPQPEATPVISIINLELVTGSGYKCDIELTVTSAFSSQSDGTKIGYAPWNRFFHGVVDKNNPQWSRVLSEFLICKRDDGRLPTIQIKGSKSTPVLPKGFEMTPQTVLTPFSLLDRENKKYSCYKEILEDNWPFLRKKLEENPNLAEIKIEGSSATVEFFLHHFYYPQKPLPPINSFGMALELVKVAYQLEIPKLLAVAVDTLIEKMDMAESTQLVELYGFIHKFKFRIQIVYKLWQVLLTKMTNRIVNEGNWFNASDSVLSTKSFTEDGYFNFSLLQELAGDLNQPPDGDAEPIDEDKAKRIKAERVINRFKDFVFEKTQSKLRTRKIQLW